MIRCNLAILLAERSLKITKVSKDTGISRTTLTSLSNNQAQGVQFETIDTLCNYLNVGPSDLFRHIRGTVTIKDVFYDHPNSAFQFIFNASNGVFEVECSLSGSYTAKIDNNNVLDRIHIRLFFEIDDGYFNEDLFADDVIELFSMPVSFMNDFMEELTACIEKELHPFFRITKDFDVAFAWPDEFSTFLNESI